MPKPPRIEIGRASDLFGSQDFHQNQPRHAIRGKRGEIPDSAGLLLPGRDCNRCQSPPVSRSEERRIFLKARISTKISRATRFEEKGGRFQILQGFFFLVAIVIDAKAPPYRDRKSVGSF